MVVGGQRAYELSPFRTHFWCVFASIYLKHTLGGGENPAKYFSLLLFSFMTQCRRIQILGHLLQNILMLHVNVCVNGENIYIMKQRRLLKYLNHNDMSNKQTTAATLKTKL